MSIATHQLGVLPPKLDELIDYLVCAWFCATSHGGQPVALGIFTEMIEASISMTGPPGRWRIHLFEIPKHCLDRSVHAIEVQPVKTGEALLGVSACVPSAEPGDELDRDRVAPHPSRKTPEITQRFVRILIFAAARHKAMYPEGIRPIGFEGDAAEPLPLDQSLGQLRARFVKFVRAM